MRRRQAGFSLIELLVVLSLLAVLMGLSVGLLQAMGSGNTLIQATTSLANLLSAARSQAYGAQTTYVTVGADESGRPVFRVYRDRQVFHWPCEDLENASEVDVMKPSGGIEIVGGGNPGREGRYAQFGSGGQVSLGSPPWLRFVDGFSVQCRIRPDEGAGGTIRLFKKGRALEVNLVGGEAGRLGLEAKVLLEKDAEGEGGGEMVLRTGNREGTEVEEWASPVIPGRWHDVRVAYDRNTFAIHVNGRLRAVRSDRRNAMKPSDEALVVGGGFAGGFDSLLIAGIFEDDQDYFEAPGNVEWLDENGSPKTGTTAYVHFRNRSLDPRFHAQPVRLVFRLARSGEDQGGAKRLVKIGLSGETFVMRPAEE